ncbi:hypothetical protein GCM10010441_39330 [Kitasatospora paracochleata]|uniref:Ferritin-like domain-containing protein n=1 Tax=Kitasatospora paracochleata TaxID=58354 RepID=A0ABT1J9V7_9ACTN|nr:hypothetical protein [Kitasatospora paracochleata]MCP2314245.1 hypothetical protein [Kitasatospora paracochleata]
MWREIAPLLAEEGITEDTDPTDLPTLQAALDRAVARYNAALFIPTGKARSQAAELLRQVVASIAADETEHAARLLDSFGPDPTAGQPVTNSHAAGLAVLLLDSWSTGTGGTPAGLLAGTVFPAGQWRGERAATDILALSHKSRAHRSVQKLIVQHGGHHVTDGAVLALAAAVLTWSRRTSTPAADVAEAAIG